MRAGWPYGKARVTREQMTATERALAESTERYRSLFDYNRHAALSLDLEGRFTDANAVASETSGYTLEEFLQISFGDLIVDDDLPTALDIFAAAIDRKPQLVEIAMRHRDGHVMELSISVAPVVVDDQVVGVHAIAEDVTERNEMRRELERTRHAAEEASAAKSLFLANMSHEVRTPLTSVLGATELLSEADLDAQQASLVDLIRRSGEKLLRLVNDILDVSRLEQGTVDVTESSIDLRLVVEEAIAWAIPIARQEKLDFAWDVDPEIPASLAGDAMRITQVVTNLLGNAFKFTDPGGRVDLTVEAGRRDDDVIHVHFVIADTGIGIPSGQLNSLFESFTQADTSTTRKYGGAGLGLAICQELASLMGGTIHASSTPGTGSRFVFTLPMVVLPLD